MAKAMRLLVTYQDGREVNVKVLPRAQVMAERHFDSALVKLEKNEDLFYLGWCATTVSGLEHGNFDSFVDRIENVEIAGDEPVVPTPQAQSPDTSSDSA